MTDDDTRSFDDVQAEVTGGGSIEPRFKKSRGEIDGYTFMLQIDGDAPDELVARIESALADVKAEQNKTEPTGTEWICPDCGDTMSLQEACEAWPCIVCGEQMVLRDASGVTPNDELRALIDEWREKANEARQEGLNGYHHAVKDCADELEALLDDTQDNE